MTEKNKTPKTPVSEKSEKDMEKETKVIIPDILKENDEIEDEYYEQPPSDSDFDICGPLNCDKQL